MSDAASTSDVIVMQHAPTSAKGEVAASWKPTVGSVMSVARPLSAGRAAAADAASGKAAGTDVTASWNPTVASVMGTTGSPAAVRGADATASWTLTAASVMGPRKPRAAAASGASEVAGDSAAALRLPSEAVACTDSELCEAAVAVLWQLSARENDGCMGAAWWLLGRGRLWELSRLLGSSVGRPKDSEGGR